MNKPSYQNLEKELLALKSSHKKHLEKQEELLQENKQLKNIQEKNTHKPTATTNNFITINDDKAKIVDTGFDDYISKPMSQDVLFSTVNKHLKRKNS